MIDINWNPSRRELRQFAGIWFPGLLAVIGVVVFYHTGSVAAAAWIWGPAFVLSVLGCFVPRLIRPVFIACTCATYPIGWLVSCLLLAVIYYLILTPIGLVMRLLGRDPLGRKFDRSATTYWIVHDPSPDRGRYFRQF